MRVVCEIGTLCRTSCLNRWWKGELCFCQFKYFPIYLEASTAKRMMVRHSFFVCERFTGQGAAGLCCGPARQGCVESSRNTRPDGPSCKE